MTLAYQQCFANFSNFSGAHHSLVCEEVLHREPRLQVRLLLPLHPPHRPPHPRSCRQNLHKVRSIVSSWVILSLNSLKRQILWAYIEREFYALGFLFAPKCAKSQNQLPFHTMNPNQRSPFTKFVPSALPVTTVLISELEMPNTMH